METKIIGGKIAAARKRLSFSQAQLAEQLFISPQAVGKWERGESMPDITTLNRLADILCVDLNYFSSTSQTVDDGNTKLKTESTQKTSSNRTNEWNWDMSRGNWKDADFSGLENLKEKFSSSNMRNCQFKDSDLSGLILSKNNIELCDFSSSNIRESKIQSSNLSNNGFNYCSFIDAEFFKSNIGKCDFSEANFSGATFLETNFEDNVIKDALWVFTSFKRTNISKVVFSGTLENCHFEHCSFYQVRFENAILLNTFFKYNDRFKKVQFINCTVDKLTYAFLKNNQANMEGITLIE